MAHHSIAIGLHVTTLILLKGILDSTGTHLIQDKIQLDYSYPCDGPGRGGTCESSSWDSIYLAMFWQVNTVSWIIFYYHWRILTLYQNNSTFDESTYLGSWFRDYLWYNSSSLINGYNSLGSNDISIWNWVFLAAHLCWSVSFMFLISWRGYWQELVDIISFIHLNTAFIQSYWLGNIYSPSALNIVQSRLVGIVHFTIGLIVTYASFIAQ